MPTGRGRHETGPAGAATFCSAEAMVQFLNRCVGWLGRFQATVRRFVTMQWDCFRGTMLYLAKPSPCSNSVKHPQTRCRLLEGVSFVQGSASTPVELLTDLVGLPWSGVTGLACVGADRAAAADLARSAAGSRPVTDRLCV